MKKTFRILLVAITLMVMQSCLPRYLVSKTVKFMDNNLEPTNQVCFERGHVRSEITKTEIVKRDVKYDDLDNYTIKIIPSDTTIHYECLRCNQNIIEPVSIKRETIWNK